MSCGCDTRIIQIAGGGAGGGPFNVAPNVPAAGQVTVTDTASGNSFVINVTGLIDFSVLTPAQLTALCAAIVANCNVGTSLNLAGNVIQLLDGQGDILDTVDLSALLTPVNIYNTNGALTGNRVVTQGGNDITFVTGGGDFIIDGKLTVTGIIDPTGLQFTGGVQADAAMPNGTIYVTDGSASGFPSGEIIFKDFGGVYARLENVAGGSVNLYNTDGTLTTNRIVTQAGSTLQFTGGPFQTVDNQVSFSTSSGNSAFLTVNTGPTISQVLVTTSEARVAYQSGLNLNGVQATAGALQLNIAPTSEMLVNGNPGTAGQALVSQGPGLPPVWGTATSSNIYTTDGTLSGARLVNVNNVQLTFGNTSAAGVNFIPDATSGNGAILRLYELPTNGSNHVQVRSPQNLAANTLFQLPPTNGAAGQSLITDGTGITTWGSAAAAVPGKSMFSRNIAVLGLVGPTIPVPVLLAWGTAIPALPAHTIAAWPGGGITANTGAGITFNAGATPVTLAGGTGVTYRLSTQITLSHTVANTTIFAQIVDSTTNVAIGVGLATVSPNKPGEISIVAYHAPANITENYQVRLGSDTAGDVSIHSLTMTVERLG
jgi:hypothetical protein